MEQSRLPASNALLKMSRFVNSSMVTLIAMLKLRIFGAVAAADKDSDMVTYSLLLLMVMVEVEVEGSRLNQRVPLGCYNFHSKFHYHVDESAGGHLNL